ncbi:MAG: hypothetical protein ABIL52_04100 [candidate division WOR-3 bacterium]
MMELVIISHLALIKGAQISGKAKISPYLFQRMGKIDYSLSTSKYYTPSLFVFTDIYTDSSANQYGLLSTLHKPLYASANGDTILYCFRRVDPAGGSGRIGVAWSFDGGATWQTAGNINGNASGRYPSAVGFTSGGAPVCSWPELVGGNWGAMCVGTPSGVKCTGNLGTYRSIGWQIAPDTFALLGFTATNVHYYTVYDAVNNVILIDPPIAIRDPGLNYDDSPFAVSFSGDSVFIVALDNATGSMGYYILRKDGTTEPDPNTANFIDTLALYAFTINGKQYSSIMDIDTRFEGNYIWNLYTLQANPAPYSDTTVSHILVLQLYDRTQPSPGLVKQWVFAPWNSSANDVELRLPIAHQPKLGVSGSRVVAMWVEWTDTLDSGCGTNNSPYTPSPKDIVYAATQDGGQSWGANKVYVNKSVKLEDFVWLARISGSDMGPTADDSLIIVYLHPMDNSTDIHCNALNDGGVTATYNYIAKDRISYSNNDSKDSLIIVDVSERYSKADDIIIKVFKNQIKVSNAKGVVSLYRADGSLISNKKGENIVFNVREGVYIIRANSKSYKVIVK